MIIFFSSGSCVLCFIKTIHNSILHIVPANDLSEHKMKNGTTATFKVNLPLRHLSRKFKENVTKLKIIDTVPSSRTSVISHANKARYRCDKTHLGLTVKVECGISRMTLRGKGALPGAEPVCRVDTQD
jgi:hypothetical protein